MNHALFDELTNPNFKSILVEKEKIDLEKMNFKKEKKTQDRSTVKISKNNLKTKPTVSKVTPKNKKSKIYSKSSKKAKKFTFNLNGKKKNKFQYTH